MQKTREQMIDQIYQVADNWGIERPDLKSTSDDILRKLTRKLDREGRKLAEHQS